MELPTSPLRRPGRSGIPMPKVALLWILATLNAPGVAAPEEIVSVWFLY